MELAMKRKSKQRRYIHLKVREVAKIKKKLLEEREKLLININSIDQSEYYIKREELSDPVDEACANVQASQGLRFNTRDKLYLQKIEKQLGRIDDRAFGECDECGSAIEFNRLMARPTAEKCILCKESAETDEKMNIYQRRSKSQGRTMQELGEM